MTLQAAKASVPFLRHHIAHPHIYRKNQKSPIDNSTLVEL